MSIPFTQYLRPNGRRQTVNIDLDEATETKARSILAAGLTFEAEVLSDDHTVSFTIVDEHSETGDVAIRLVANGPGVPAAVADLINNFDLAGYRQRNPSIKRFTRLNDAFEGAECEGADC